jgi:hypothetical protein
VVFGSKLKRLSGRLKRPKFPEATTVLPSLLIKQAVSWLPRTRAVRVLSKTVRPDPSKVIIAPALTGLCSGWNCQTCNQSMNKPCNLDPRLFVKSAKLALIGTPLERCKKSQFETDRLRVTPEGRLTLKFDRVFFPLFEAPSPPERKLAKTARRCFKKPLDLAKGQKPSF